MTHYVRMVEVVSLETLARLLKVAPKFYSTQNPSFNIYERKYRTDVSPTLCFEAPNITVLSDPCWKLVWDRYLVDEYGHSDKLTIKGIESWPEYGGKYTVRCGEEERINDDYIYIIIGSDRNHYHMVLNFLPRMIWFQRYFGRIAGDRFRFVVGEGLSENAIRLLEIAGVPRDQLFQIADRKAYTFRRAVVASLFPSQELFREVADWLRTLGNLFRDPAGQRRRILLSRDDATQGGFGRGTQRRRVRNQEELFGLLAGYGFEKCDFARMTMDQQIAAAVNAEIVVGPHGAGLANFAFSDPGTKALVFENGWHHTFMADMNVPLAAMETWLRSVTG